MRPFGPLPLASLLALVLALVLPLACARPGAETPAAGSAAGAAGSPESWVSIYDPDAAWNGFTLAYYGRRYPILIDMRGRIVHSWPEARSRSRARLLPDCTLLTIGKGRGVAEYDWDGNKVWSASFPDRFPHHDVIRLAGGNTMMLSRATTGEADDIIEIDRDGEIVWRWESFERLASYIEARSRRHTGDTTHMNSVHELPDNPWFRDGDERFRPGNILASARNLSLVFIIDKGSRELVWTYEAELDLQHEALMIADGGDRDGRIVIFNNRYGSFERDRGSVVLEIDPSDASVRLGYGLDRRALDQAGVTDYEATFSLTLRNPANEVEVVVFEDTVDQDALEWRERTVDLGELSHKPAVVCVRLEESGHPGEARFAYWGAPVIQSADIGDEDEDEATMPDPQGLTAEELEVRREHLRAMGYVN